MTSRGRTGAPWRGLLVGAFALAVVVAAIVFVASAVSTSSARVAATTSSDGLLSTATIALDQPGEAVEFVLDSDGLYPGAVATGCVVVDYTGSIPVDVRLHGAPTTSGLDRFVDFRLGLLAGTECPDPIDAAAGSERFAGRLDTFWAQHGSFGRGVLAGQAVTSGTRIVVVASATVVDDNRAQGRSTDFTLTIEARPA